MEAQTLAALITAPGTILAAVIGVTGVLAIVQHRKKVTRLAEQVEAYYHHETALLRELHRLRHPEQTLSDGQLRSYRGRLRTRLSSNALRPTMTATEAQQQLKGSVRPGKAACSSGLESRLGNREPRARYQASRREG